MNDRDCEDTGEDVREVKGEIGEESKDHCKWSPSLGKEHKQTMEVMCRSVKHDVKAMSH